jgi:hypothetical protein
VTLDAIDDAIDERRVAGMATAIARSADALVGLLRLEVDDARAIDLAEGAALSLSDLVDRLQELKR